MKEDIIKIKKRLNEIKLELIDIEKNNILERLEKLKKEEEHIDRLITLKKIRDKIKNLNELKNKEKEEPLKIIEENIIEKKEPLKIIEENISIYA